MNFTAVVGILMLYTYATAIAAPSPLRYGKPESNVTLTLALTSTANALPPDPNIIEFPSVGRVRCYSYGYSHWEDDIRSVLAYAVTIDHLEIVAGRGDLPVRYSQRYSMGYASLYLDVSPQITWLQLSLVLEFMILNAQAYSPGTFLLEVSGGPSGDWNGSLTTELAVKRSAKQRYTRHG